MNEYYYGRSSGGGEFPSFPPPWIRLWSYQPALPMEPPAHIRPGSAYRNTSGDTTCTNSRAANGVGSPHNFRAAMNYMYMYQGKAHMSPPNTTSGIISPHCKWPTYTCKQNPIGTAPSPPPLLIVRYATELNSCSQQPMEPFLQNTLSYPGPMG